MATRYLAASAAQKTARSLASAPRNRGSRGREVAPAREVLPDDIAAVSETVVVRRVWIRRP